MQPAIIHDRRGAALIEFALASPIFLAALIGLVQLGQMMFAGAEVRSIVGDAARILKTNPDLTESELEDYIASRVANTNAVTVGTPYLEAGVNDDGVDFREISLTYTVTLDFVFFELDPFTVDASRRVYVYP